MKSSLHRPKKKLSRRKKISYYWRRQIRLLLILLSLWFFVYYLFATAGNPDATLMDVFKSLIKSIKWIAREWIMLFFD